MGDETVGVVGGGIVGLAVARELVLRRPGTRVAPKGDGHGGGADNGQLARLLALEYTFLHRELFRATPTGLP